MKYYAGIGSRKTPPAILQIMTNIANKMRVKEYTLRSGGAIGADKAFEQGAGDLKKIFTADSHLSEAAMMTVDKYHPAPHRLNPYGKRLMARNSMQILGEDLNSPVEIVFCWTPDGADGTKILTSQETGGTGQAIRIAASHNIHVINLQNPLRRNIVLQWLES